MSEYVLKRQIDEFDPERGVLDDLTALKRYVSTANCHLKNLVRKIKLVRYE